MEHTNDSSQLIEQEVCMFSIENCSLCDLSLSRLCVVGPRPSQRQVGRQAGKGDNRLAVEYNNGNENGEARLPSIQPGRHTTHSLHSSFFYLSTPPKAHFGEQLLCNCCSNALTLPSVAQVTFCHGRFVAAVASEFGNNNGTVSLLLNKQWARELDLPFIS